MSKKRDADVIKSMVVISDLHCGSQLGLCPPIVRLDSGGYYQHNKAQAKVWGAWQEFWYDWVPRITDGEPFAVVVNGDIIDGRHHGSTDQISQNLADQERIAIQCLEPFAKQCAGRFFVVRGTSAHVGPSGEGEESVASALGAVKDSEGNSSRNELWIKVGSGLCHIMHHIGTAGSMHYESTAVMRELSEEYTEAGRHSRRPPDVVIRSHRHRAIMVQVPTENGLGISMTTPGWQLKTDFVFRIAGARISTPQIGGCVIRQGDEDVYARLFYRGVGSPKTEVVHV
jgi:hypothetical protein